MRTLRVLYFMSLNANNTLHNWVESAVFSVFGFWVSAVCVENIGYADEQKTNKKPRKQSKKNLCVTVI